MPLYTCRTRGGNEPVGEQWGKEGGRRQTVFYGRMPPLSSVSVKAVKIVLGSDHAGFELKEAVKAHLLANGYEVEDVGTHSNASCDYPDFVIPAAEKVARSNGNARGIVFGGSGIGECIAANKVKGIRAALVFDEFTAKATREHNDSNVLSLGGRTVTGNPELANKLVDIWLTTAFSGDDRHVRRIRKISDYENSH